MVTFTCNNCGNSVTKAKVEKHILAECKSRNKRRPSLSCIDCLVDFNDVSYASHIKCLTEAQKYNGPNYIAKQSSNKGERKQELWTNAVISASKNPDIAKKHRKLLEALSNYNNVPRQKNKFQNFIKSSVGMFRLDEPELLKIHELIEKEFFNLKSASNSDSAPNNLNSVSDSKNLSSNNVNSLPKNEITNEIIQKDGNPDCTKSKKKKITENENSDDMNSQETLTSNCINENQLLSCNETILVNNVSDSEQKVSLETKKHKKSKKKEITENERNDLNSQNVLNIQATDENQLVLNNEGILGSSNSNVDENTNFETVKNKKLKKKKKNTENEINDNLNIQSIQNIQTTDANELPKSDENILEKNILNSSEILKINSTSNDHEILNELIDKENNFVTVKSKKSKKRKHTENQNNDLNSQGNENNQLADENQLTLLDGNMSENISNFKEISKKKNKKLKLSVEEKSSGKENDNFGDSFNNETYENNQNNTAIVDCADKTESFTCLQNLSKKERKEMKKKLKYEAQLKSIESEPNNIICNNDDDDKEKKSKKKRKMSENDSSENVEVKKSKLNEIVENNSITESVCAKFNWEETVKTLLLKANNKEMSLKRVSKKVINEYFSMYPERKAYEDVLKRFNKKIVKIPFVKVFKDKVKLILDD